MFFALINAEKDHIVKNHYIPALQNDHELIFV